MNKTVSDYVEKSAGGYEKYMERKSFSRPHQILCKKE